MRIQVEVDPQQALINKLRNQRNIAMTALDRLSKAAHMPAKQLRAEAKAAWERAAVGGNEDDNG